MKTYYKIVTYNCMRGTHVIQPIAIEAKHKPKNRKNHFSSHDEFYDFFESEKEAEDFADYMCDRNFGEDFNYDCSKYGKQKWRCGIEPWNCSCKDCEFSKKKQS